MKYNEKKRCIALTFASNESNLECADFASDIHY